MNWLVFDLEANGLLEEATHAHVACWTNHRGQSDYTTDVQDFCNILSCANDQSIIIAHNCIDYDLPLLKKLYGYEHKGHVLDTVVLSRLLNPERVGRHSLDAWGERLGVAKPKHEDWSTYSPEMLHRCQQDVEINVRVLHALLKEADMTLEEMYE